MRITEAIFDRAKDLIEKNPNLSTTDIAKIIGCSRSSIQLIKSSVSIGAYFTKRSEYNTSRKKHEEDRKRISRAIDLTSVDSDQNKGQQDDDIKQKTTQMVNDLCFFLDQQNIELEKIIRTNNDIIQYFKKRIGIIFDVQEKAN